tara:strand:- start:415 stop:681 length:267 start_codon:yes stop_codon:yes gene_type:complete
MENKKEIPVYICSHIFEDSRPVLLVYKEDDDLQFLCGEEHDSNEIPRVVGINHIIERDESLIEIINIENGWEAERSNINSEWGLAKFE